jgi:hypothetical protein
MKFFFSTISLTSQKNIVQQGGTGSGEGGGRRGVKGYTTPSQQPRDMAQEDDFVIAFSKTISMNKKHFHHPDLKRSWKEKICINPIINILQ